MIKFENTQVVGWEHAIRGMRNPKNSWSRSDTAFYSDGDLALGKNDSKLMNALAVAGPVHRKYLRMIQVYVDITAPLYWWKEFDTYKVGTVANSTSTMHKIQAKEFTLDDFSHEHLIAGNSTLETVIDVLNIARNKYLETKDKVWWWQMIQLLPSSYNQKRTVMMNYEVLANIFQSDCRRYHKLDEWRQHEKDSEVKGFCDWILTLPCEELIVSAANRSVCNE